MGKSIVKSAGLLLIINIGVKLLGFGREMVLANGFGASAASDAYVVAYSIPYLLQTILGYAFVSAVLPVLSSCWKEDGDNEEANRLGSSLINLTFATVAVLAVLGCLLAPALVRLTAPALAEETRTLAISLTRIIFPSVVFMAAGMVISGILNSRFRFVAAAVAPGVASLAIIAATVFFADGNIFVVAIGTLLGYVCFSLLQAADLPKTGFKYRFVCDLQHPQLRRVAKDIVPITLGLAVNQFYIIINRIFASGLAEGAISALNYANKLLNLPLALFVASIITAVFPTLAEQANKQDLQALGKTVSQWLTMALLVVLPASLGLMLLDGEVVRLLFQSGSFDASDALVTAQSLFAMCPGMVFIGSSMLLCRVSYAIGDTKTPLICGALSLAVNLLLCLALKGPLLHAGLAWANSIAAAVHAIMLGFMLNKKVRFADKYFGRSLLKSALASVVMCLVVLLMKSFIDLGGSGFGLILNLAVVIIVAVLAYALTLMLLRTEALLDVLRQLKKK